MKIIFSFLFLFYFIIQVYSCSFSCSFLPIGLIDMSGISDILYSILNVLSIFFDF